MSKIKLVVFDLAGTTVKDDNAVAKCLYEGATTFGIHATLEDFQKTIGTNKIRLYEFMIARDHGKDVSIEQLESYHFPEYNELAKKVFHYYSGLMVAHYSIFEKSIPTRNGFLFNAKSNALSTSSSLNPPSIID